MVEGWTLFPKVLNHDDIQQYIEIYHYLDKIIVDITKRKYSYDNNYRYYRTSILCLVY